MTETEIQQLYQKKVVDNRNVTMEFALNNLLSKDDVNRFDIAVGYFYISGLLLVKEQFIKFMEERNGRMYVLMGNSTNKETLLTIDTATKILETIDVDEKETYRNTFHKEISHLDEPSRTFLMKFIDWVEQKRIEIKVYTGTANYFHAKSYLIYSSKNHYVGSSLVGSSNFSKNGLIGNTELNVYSMDGFSPLYEWFYSLWSSDEVEVFNDELIKTIREVYPTSKEEKRYKPVSETYFDFAQIFAKPYAELDNSAVWQGLYAHQRSGIIKIQDKLMQFGTAVLADGVGLGKTRTTAGVIRLAMETKENMRVVIIADKKLHEQWKDEMDAVGVNYSQFSFINRETFALMKAAELDKIADNYQMIVIDEGHMGFKNRNTMAYRHGEYIYSRAGGKMKGLILTATPWNNHREDVINIGSLLLDVENIPVNRAYKNYFMFGNRGKAIRKLAEDDKAFGEFWEDLFLQRTRKTYGGESVQYATRTFPAIEVPFEPGKEQIFSNNFERIDALHFPYMDMLRFFDPENAGFDLTQGRLKLMLLKRADSSWVSFVQSLEKIIQNTEQMLKDFEAIEYSSDFTKRLKNYLANQYRIEEYYAKNFNLFGMEDDSGLEDQLKEFQIASLKNKRKYIERISSKIEEIKKAPAQRVFNRLKANATKDLEILRSIISEVEASFTRKDEKYEVIRKQVIEERIKGKKIILVSQFRSTVQYYFDRLLTENQLNNDDIGIVTGHIEDNKIGINPFPKKEILERFSPKSKKRKDLFGSTHEINILIGTDTISTGQNLQDATILMNLDLPYNPMLLEQRIGRIDRPREDKTVEEIDIYTFPTYAAIESILKMTQRLGSKMEGIYQDTDFDDFVLPEYKEYVEALLEERSTTRAAKAMENMLDQTEAKNIFQLGVQADKHSSAYDEANKRMYDTLQQGIARIEKVVYPKISFSADTANSVAVCKVIYRDINEEEIKQDTIIFDINHFVNSDISSVEQKLLKAKIASIYSTRDYVEASAEVKKKDLDSILNRALRLYVEKYNEENTKTVESFEDISDNTAKKAASKIKESISDQTKRNAIRSKIEAQGLTGKEVLTLATNIEFISPDNDLYEYVQNIANDVDEFWMNFPFYVEQFDLKNIQVTNGRLNTNRPTKKVAVVENSEYELLLANISTK